MAKVVFQPSATCVCFKRFGASTKFWESEALTALLDQELGASGIDNNHTPQHGIPQPTYTYSKLTMCQWVRNTCPL